MTVCDHIAHRGAAIRVRRHFQSGHFFPLLYTDSRNDTAIVPYERPIYRGSFPPSPRGITRVPSREAIIRSRGLDTIKLFLRGKIMRRRKRKRGIRWEKILLKCNSFCFLMSRHQSFTLSWPIERIHYWRLWFSAGEMNHRWLKTFRREREREKRAWICIQITRGYRTY